MKYLCFLFLIIFSCKQQEHTNVVCYISVEKKGKTSYGNLEIVYLKVDFSNKSNDSLFITRIGSFYFEGDYISIHENYGSWQNSIDARIGGLNYFLKNKYKKGSLKDTFRITLPAMTQRYYLNHQKDSIDFFTKESELNKVYHSAFIAGSKDPYAVPLPPPIEPKSKEHLFIEKVLKEKNIEFKDYEIDDFLKETVFLKPGETKVLEYDISSFFLQKATYEFVFEIDPMNVNSLTQKKINENLDEISGYERYSKKIISNTLKIKSE